MSLQITGRATERTRMKNVLFYLLILLSFSAMAQAQPLTKIALSQPDLDSGKSLMQCLKERKTSRAFSDRELSPQELSNLLWAADGINRPEEGKRTAPSAMNRQEIDVYVMLKTGIYLYDPKEPALLPVAEGDHRKIAGLQAYAATAPVNLFYVPDLNKFKGPKKEQRMASGVNAGYISQNVYLYCASAGMATVARGSIDARALAKALKLKPGQEVILGQSVGWPK
jgi:SagB-type dehydrogenase family enzyme